MDPSFGLLSGFLRRTTFEASCKFFRPSPYSSSRPEGHGIYTNVRHQFSCSGSTLPRILASLSESRGAGINRIGGDPRCGSVREGLGPALNWRFAALPTGSCSDDCPGCREPIRAAGGVSLGGVFRKFRFRLVPPLAPCIIAGERKSAWPLGKRDH